jgi:hypothetical protein
MISILNFILTIVFYVMRWIKLDSVCICFTKFANQVNLLYIYICLYLQQDMSYEMHELDRRPKFFTGPSLAQWATIAFFIFSSTFNFGVIFMHLCSMFILN